MALQEEFEKTGAYFFRWRSYLPLIMAVFFILALVGYRTPFKNPGLNLAWDGFCLAVALLGEGIRCFTVGYVPRGTSGRNTKGQVADTLNTSGLYAVVRNPLYLGNFVIWFGLSLFMKLWWFTTLISLFFLIFYERIIFTEERFLREKFGDEFLQWAEQDPGHYSQLQELAAAGPALFVEIGPGPGIRLLLCHHRHLYGIATAGGIV